MATFEKESGSSAAAFLAGVGVGAIIGAAAGVLFAPKPGAETREQLGEKFGEIKEKVGAIKDKVSDKVHGWTKDGREKLASTMDDVASKVGA